MWMITKNHLDDMNVLIRSNDSVKIADCPHIFRILDDDGILYYTGYSSTKDDEDAFRPLDDFAQPNDGATEIQYLEDGKWETL